VSLDVKTNIKPFPVMAMARVGIDVSIKALVTLSTGETIVSIWHLQQAQQRLAQLDSLF
jgi:transposase